MLSPSKKAARNIPTESPTAKITPQVANSLGLTSCAWLCPIVVPRLQTNMSRQSSSFDNDSYSRSVFQTHLWGKRKGQDLPESFVSRPGKNVATVYPKSAKTIQRRAAMMMATTMSSLTFRLAVRVRPLKRRHGRLVLGERTSPSACREFVGCASVLLPRELLIKNKIRTRTLSARRIAPELQTSDHQA